MVGTVNTKVFCIGFHKTGTTSLGKALKILGYKVKGPFGIEVPDIGEKVLELFPPIVNQYDAFQDNPWPILYRELDEQYPNSKFILLVRDPGAWLESMIRHFGTRETPMRKWIYGESAGCPMDNEEIYLERFNRHYADVYEYFRLRPDDLLIMDIATGDGWDTLCSFLGCDTPRKSFPHANKANSRSQGLRNRLKRLRGTIFRRHF